MNFHFELSQHQMPLTRAHQCSANVHSLVRVCVTKWPHTETRTNQSECALRAHVTAKRRSLLTPLQVLPPRLLDLVWNFTDWARTRCIFLSGFFHVNDGRCDEARLWLKSPQLLGNQGSASAGTTVHPPGPAVSRSGPPQLLGIFLCVLLISVGHVRGRLGGYFSVSVCARVSASWAGR